MGWSNRETVVMDLMRQGYGAEDIAVKTGLDADVIRRSFAVMRERGVLADLYRDWPPESRVNHEQVIAVKEPTA